MVGVVGSLERDTSLDLAAALERRRKWQQGVLDQAAPACPPQWRRRPIGCALALPPTVLSLAGRCLAVPRQIV